MTRRWRPLAATAISLAGFGLAAFLTWGHYFDQAAISRTCPGGSAHGFINCGAVTTSAESVIFGVPVALYGLLYFTVMVALNLPAAWRSPSRLLAWARVVLNVAGMGFVLYLVGVEFLELHYICLYCTFVHVLQFALFLVVVTGWYDTGYAERLYGDEDDDYWASRPSKLLGA